MTQGSESTLRTHNLAHPQHGEHGLCAHAGEGRGHATRGHGYARQFRHRDLQVSYTTRRVFFSGAVATAIRNCGFHCETSAADSARDPVQAPTAHAHHAHAGHGQKATTKQPADAHAGHGDDTEDAGPAMPMPA